MLVGLCAATFTASAVWAQDAVITTVAPATVQAVGPDGKPVAVKVQPPGAKTPAGQPGAKPGAQKPGEQKPGEKKPGEQKPGEPAVTQRPMKPEKPADPEELKVRPDSDGKVRFNFNGQPWPAVLDWVAKISNMSLDWQEMPGDFLNLSTQRAYTVEEARDLINRHLFARGFTMLQNDKFLYVVNIKKLDPGMVPRVSPEELATRSSYEFVKVSFALKWMMAETAAEELKPMISPSGKLNALKSTNRLEVIDAVINLRDLYKVLKEEQSTGGQERLVREFPLQFARANDVMLQLNELLGVENKAAAGPMTPQQMQQQQQAMMRMQQQQQQAQQQGKQPPGIKKEEPVNLVVNTRKNSILANAPPDKMAIIEQAVKVLDVASQGAESLLANLNRMQVYRLGELDPEPLVKTLMELGLLDPTTRLDVDKRNKSIVAYAPLADHFVIKQLIERLDRTGRTFEVIQLRRLEADYVAGTVNFMINGGNEEEQQQRRPSYYGFGYYMQNQEEEKSNDKFRVDADVENNQLILWANPLEMEEVYKLLAKLGEVPSRGGNTSTVRVLDIEPGEDAAAALERLRRAWPTVAPNPLLMPDAEIMNGAKRGSSGDNNERRPATRATRNEEARSGKSHDDQRTERNDGPTVVPIRGRAQPIEESEPLERAVVAVPAVLRKVSQKQSASDEKAEQQDAPQKATAESSQPAEANKSQAEKPDAPPQGDAGGNTGAATNGQNGAVGQGGLGQGGLGQREFAQRGPANGGQAATRQPPPVSVSVGPNGQLIITSPDTQALDLFEEMVNQFAPPRREYKVFYLKHASAFSVSLNLEEYFQLDKKEEDNNRGYPFYYYGDYGSQSKDETRRLSKRRELTFIWDPDSNTILVTGADQSQLRVIEELIELYDRQEPPDSRMARMTTVFTLRYSKAKIVGEAVKDVFRDLLSSNDKALQQGDGQKKDGKKAENVYITNFGGEEGEDPRGTQVKFKGKISIGIDEFSNTLVVSTEGENLMNTVAKMINSLDTAAKPAMNRVHVMKVAGSMDSQDVRKALARALLEQQRSQPQQPGQQQPGPNGQQPPQNGQGQQFQPLGQNVQEQ